MPVTNKKKSEWECLPFISKTGHRTSEASEWPVLRINGKHSHEDFFLFVTGILTFIHFLGTLVRILAPFWRLAQKTAGRDRPLKAANDARAPL